MANPRRRTIPTVDPNNHRAIYNTKEWRRLSRSVVRESPTCWLRLPGCTIRSTTCDHIIPVSIRPELALVRSNCAGACHSCNSLRRNVSIHQLAHFRAELAARPMTREQALEALRSKRYRQRAPALAVFDGAAPSAN